MKNYHNFILEKSNDYIQKLIKKIQSVLSEDLLKKDWKEKIKNTNHHLSAGHCYAASEALYHLLGGKENGYIPMVGKNENGTHWWLKDKNGDIIDPTAEQFYYNDINPPYENGKGTGFLTKNPSKRAQEIINRVKKNFILEYSNFVSSKEMDKLLDKISASGIESLDDIEKNKLALFSDDDKEIIKTIEEMGDITAKFKKLHNKIDQLGKEGKYEEAEELFKKYWLKLNNKIRPLEQSFRKWGIELGDERLRKFMHEIRPDVY